MEAHYRRAMAERVPVGFEKLGGRALADIRLNREWLAAFLLDIHVGGLVGVRAMRTRLPDPIARRRFLASTWDPGGRQRIARGGTTMARMFTGSGCGGSGMLFGSFYLRVVLTKTVPLVADAFPSHSVPSNTMTSTLGSQTESDWLQSWGRVDRRRRSRFASHLSGPSYITHLCG